MWIWNGWSLSYEFMKGNWLFQDCGWDLWSCELWINIGLITWWIYELWITLTFHVLVVAMWIAFNVRVCDRTLTTSIITLSYLIRYYCSLIAFQFISTIVYVYLIVVDGTMLDKQVPNPTISQRRRRRNGNFRWINIMTMSGVPMTFTESSWPTRDSLHFRVLLWDNFVYTL